MANAIDRCRFVLQSDPSFAGGSPPCPPAKAWMSKLHAPPFRACGERATQRSQSPVLGSPDDGSRAEAHVSAYVGHDVLSITPVRTGATAPLRIRSATHAPLEAYVRPAGRFTAGGRASGGESAGREALNRTARVVRPALRPTLGNCVRSYCSAWGCCFSPTRS